MAGPRLRRHRRRRRRRRSAGSTPATRVPGGARSLRARAGPGVGSRDRGLRRVEPLLRALSRAGRRLLRHGRIEAGDLSDLLVARPDGGPPERSDGHRAGVPQPAVALRIRRRAMVRSRPRLAVPRSHPPATRGHHVARARHPPRPRHARSVDDAGLPAGVPAPVRRHGRGVRPVGRRPPHRRPAVPRFDDVLGVPDVPGLDRAVGHGPRPGGAAHGADPGGDGLPAAAATSRRRCRTTTCAGWP